jgi:hypothetical protein
MDDENKAFDAYYELPGGFEVQLMVLRDYPGGRRMRGLKRSIFRSRIWIGHNEEAEPLFHSSQEHGTLEGAIASCYQMMLSTTAADLVSESALQQMADLVDQELCQKAI